MIRDLPCFVAHPYQYWVEDPAEVVRFIEDNDGKWPIFWSHNSFTSSDCRTARVRYIPFDFDSKEKPENSLLDAINLVEWADKSNVTVHVNYSGSKGFHGYLHFEPVKAENNRALARTYQRIQDHVIEEAELRTADDRIVGDPRRLMRVPNTMHEGSGRYCVEIPRSLLAERDISAIEDYASRPRALCHDERPRETLPQALDRLEFPPLERPSNGAMAPTVDYDADLAPEFVKAVLPRPCVHQHLLEKNPPHLIRLEALITMVNLRFPLHYLQGFFDRVARKAKWADRHNADRRHYQVQHAWRKGPGHYDQHSCERIREEGMCVGEACPLYEKVFGDD